MNKECLKQFTPREQKLQKQLEALFAAWNRALKKAQKNDKDLAKLDHQGIVRDGFYPRYLETKPRILFMGREAYTLDNESYIETYMQKDYRNQGGKSIDSQKVHKLILKLAYGILHDKEWDEIPKASNLCEGCLFDKLSFAFMNLSKLSHDEKGNKYTDRALLEKALAMSITDKRNFILEEIELLDPDLIVTMNFGQLGDHLLQRIFDPSSLSPYQETEYDDLLFTATLRGKTVLVCDQWHFSAPGIDEKTEIYDRTRQAWKDFQRRKK